MTSVFLDTDVTLDLFIEGEPHHSVALRFFSYLQVHADRIQAYTSPVVIANVAYILGKARSESYAVRKIKGLRDYVRVLPMTEAEVDRAILRPGDDPEAVTRRVQYCRNLPASSRPMRWKLAAG